MAVLAVIDTGPGIDPQQTTRVFERSYRGTPPGSGDTAPRTHGSGLGLAIVTLATSPDPTTLHNPV
jgi:two-component system, OmpR family, sensor kinase